MDKYRIEMADIEQYRQQHRQGYRLDCRHEYEMSL